MSLRTTDHKSNISPLVRDLANPDPAKRRRAIVQLGQTGDPEALKPLAEVYRSDPSVELRELARKAGVHISQQKKQAEERTVGPQVVEKRISPSDIQRARGYTDEALTYNMQGQNEKAVNSLSKALNLNPSLVEDTYFTGIVSMILDLPKPEALEMLKSSQQRGQYAKTVTTQRKTAAVEEHMQEARRFTGRSMSIDLALYALVCTLGPVILVLVVAQGLSQLLALSPEDAAKSAIPNFIHDLSGVVTLGSSFPALLVIVVASLLIGMLNLIGQAAIVHGVARFLLRGKGTFGFLLSKMIPLYTRYVLIFCVVGSVVVGIGGSIGFFFLIYAAAFGLALFTLLTGVKLLGSVGEAYHSGAAMGCATIMIALFALALINVPVLALLSQILTGLLSGLSAPA